MAYPKTEAEAEAALREAKPLIAMYIDGALRSPGQGQCRGAISMVALKREARAIEDAADFFLTKLWLAEAKRQREAA